MHSADEWDRVGPILERALSQDAYGGWTLADIRAAVDDGRMQLWPAVESAMVTQLVHEPQAVRLHFFLAAGNMAEIEGLYHTVINWGREQGATSATFVGRMGWARTFLTREEGWQQKMAVFQKGL